MTKRERILCAISHREPDKIPVDLGGMRSTGISAIAYSRLKEHLGIRRGHTYVYDVVQQLAQPEQEILDFAGGDVVDLGRVFLTEETDWKDFTLPDGSPAKVPTYARFQQHDGGWQALSSHGKVIGVMPKGAHYLTQTNFPLQAWKESDPSALARMAEHMETVTWSAFPTAPFHKPLAAEHIQGIQERAGRLYKETDYAIMVGFGGNLLEWGEYLCGFEQFLSDILNEPRKVHALLDKLLEMHLDNLGKLLPAISGFVQVIQLGDDLGGQHGPLISPRQYRDFFKPRHKVIVEEIKKRSDLHVFLHSCGSIADLLPDIIEIGVEIINPVQTSAQGMDPARLKREFGKDLTFWGGGCDTQRMLSFGSRAEIREHVRQRLEILSPGGGYVFTQVHNIMPNVPPQNVVAMYEAVKKYR